MSHPILPGTPMMLDLTARITTDPKRRGGRPCIRDTSIRVVDVLRLLATGLTNEQVLARMPELEAEDILAALQYVIRKTESQAMDA